MENASNFKLLEFWENYFCVEKLDNWFGDNFCIVNFLVLLEKLKFVWKVGSW